MAGEAMDIEVIIMIYRLAVPAINIEDEMEPEQFDPDSFVNQ